MEDGLGAKEDDLKLIEDDLGLMDHKFLDHTNGKYGYTWYRYPDYMDHMNGAVQIMYLFYLV